MRAAIYARKSNEQFGVADEEKSVTRQVKDLEEFVAKKDWKLIETYIDDGVSGQLFRGRKEFMRMMEDAEEKLFDVLVFFDLNRFGRHARSMRRALDDLDELGIEVWDSSEGRIDLDSFEGEIKAMFKSRSAQQFVDDITKANVAKAIRLAKDGHVTGGRTFGYRNEKVDPNQEKSAKKHVIIPAEAEVVRQIFEMAAEGLGMRKIAAALNNAGVPKPRAKRKGSGPDGWSVSTIRAVLRRTIYRGEVTFGKRKKVRLRGKGKEKGRINLPEEDWLVIPAPHLRIVDDDLWWRVHNIWKEREGRYKRNEKPAPEKSHGKYLLTGGMLLCPQCGGAFEALKTPWSRPEEQEGVYVCATRRRKPGVCTNPQALPIKQTDEVMLSIIEHEVFNPKYIEELLSKLDTGQEDTRARLAQDKKKLEEQIENLTEMVAVGDLDPRVTADKIKQRQGEIKGIEAQIAKYQEPPNIEKLREALRLQGERWKADLRAEPKVARVVLRKLIGPITLHGEKPEYLQAKIRAYDSVVSPRERACRTNTKVMNVETTRGCLSMVSFRARSKLPWWHISWICLYRVRSLKCRLHCPRTRVTR